VILRDLLDSTKSLVYTDFLNKITSVKYSPDGKYLAIGSENGQVRLVTVNEEAKGDL
jgi:WD40 repeat protein